MMSTACHTDTATYKPTHITCSDHKTKMYDSCKCKRYFNLNALIVIQTHQKVAQPSDLPPLRCAYLPSYLQVIVEGLLSCSHDMACSTMQFQMPHRFSTVLRYVVALLYMSVL